MSDKSNRSVNGEAQRVVPSKFAHAVLRTNKLEEMVNWYTTVTAGGDRPLDRRARLHDLR